MTGAVCPKCEQPLAKPPRGKGKCKSCGERILAHPSRPGEYPFLDGMRLHLYQQRRKAHRAELEQALRSGVVQSAEILTYGHTAALHARSWTGAG